MDTRTFISLIELTDEEKAELKELAGAQVMCVKKEDLTDVQLDAADFLLGNMAPARMGKAKKLKFVQLWSSGFAEYTDKKLYNHPVVIASATGSYGQAVSEHALSLTWLLLRG